MLLLIHNYFPVPQTPLVINIASLNSEIRKKSIDQIKKSIDYLRVVLWAIGKNKYKINYVNLLLSLFKQDYKSDSRGTNEDEQKYNLKKLIENDSKIKSIKNRIEILN